MHLRKRLAICTAGAAAVTVLAGCNGSFQGHGSMAGASRGQAQISFKVLCNTKTQKVSGSMEYADAGSGVLILGSANAHPSGTDGTSDYSCDNNTDHGDYLGQYLSFANGSTAQFEFKLDADSSCATGYEASLDLLTSNARHFTPYSNSGCLTSGSVTPIKD